MVSLSAFVGVTALAIVGLCNTVGSYCCGVLGSRFRKKRVLGVIFAFRAVVIAIYVSLPVTPLSTCMLAMASGFTGLALCR